MSDFEDMAETLLRAQGMLQVSAHDLPGTIARLLESPDERTALGSRGRAAGLKFAGGTAGHRALLCSMLGHSA